MPRRACLLTILFVAGFSFFAVSQSFELPENIELFSAEDFTRHEPDIIKAAGWLETTPVGQQTEKRTLVNAFVIKWLTGSPSVSVEVTSLVGKLSDKNPELLGMFLAGYARWCLQNKNNKDALNATTAAVKSMINLYSLGGKLKKNKLLQKAMEADKAGRLAEWVMANDKK